MRVSLFQLNPDVNAFQRKFVSEILRCEEMERKLSKVFVTADLIVIMMALLLIRSYKTFLTQNTVLQYYIC